MTANAMEGDRQRCFEAGMNDHVAKPIDPAVLWATLARWLPARAPQAAPGVATPGVSTPGTPEQPQGGGAPSLPRGVAGLDTALGLQRALGRPALYAEMLQRFVEGQRAAVQTIAAAQIAGDWALAERTAHTLRSVAANIGAEPLAEHARALEQALRERAGAAMLTPLLAALGAALPPLLQALDAWAGTAVARDEAPVSTGEPAAALRGLRALLLEDDPAAVDYLRRHEGAIARLMGPELEALHRSVRGFAFEQALELLDAQPLRP